MNILDSNQYEHHSNHYKVIKDRGLEGYDGFINSDSIWYFMHTHCLDDIKIFFDSISRSKFLTVGDGYCGRESVHIKRFGHYVHSSDIETCLIEIAYNNKLIDEYSSQDMNKLDFNDNDFDYVLTKESLHHLSEPYKGLYEMLRVAKNGVILIEPNGDNDQKDTFTGYEVSGNYMFTFTSHELIKIGLSYGYNYFVWTYSYMFYGFHNMDNIINNKIREEKQRLIELDNKTRLEDKPLLTFFFLRNESDYNIFDGNRFRKFVMKNHL